MKKNEMDTYIRRAQNAYSDSYASMKWLTPEDASTASDRRAHLISKIFDNRTSGPGWQFSETKLFTHAISPGCSLCGQGDWSCLFINGVCNAQCFYCPSAQKEKGQPVTSTIEFSSAHDYADYINAFDIKGVSFSGGEPFMTFDRVMRYLKTLRTKVAHPLYVWMYTNGLLVTEDKLKALKDNGLDEIRFDISANRYHLDAVKKAVGIIPCVTVEIPAIPEDLSITRPLIKQLHETGIDYLNLHQIRCTPFNKSRLIKRGYTFVNGPGIAVMETETAALELIRHALDNNIFLPVNYCSFIYRHQFQRAGAQRRNALKIKAAHEDVTPTGQIRSLSILGTQQQIKSINNRLLSTVENKNLWILSKNNDQLSFCSDLWPLIDFSNTRLKVVYSGTALTSSVTYRHVFKEIGLNKKKKVVIERHPRHKGFFFNGDQIPLFGEKFILSNTGFSKNGEDNLSADIIDEIKSFEHFTPGLADYA